MKSIGLLLIALLFSAFAAAQTRMIEIEVNAGAHRVLNSWVVEGDFSDRPAPPSEQNLQINLWRGEQLIETYWLANPVLLHTPLLANGQESQHEQLKPEGAIYHLRVPNSLGVDRVTVNTPLKALPAQQPIARSLNKTQQPLLEFSF